MSAELPATAANQAEWPRLVAAVELTPGFAIFVVVVSEPSLAEPVEQVIATLMEQHGVARCERWYDSDPLDVLLAASPDRPRYQIISLVPREVGSLRDDPERNTALLMRLNQRRDVIRTRLAGPLFLLVDRERMRSFPGYAPDLWSAHAAVFRFGRGIRIDAIDIARFLIPGVHDQRDADVAQLAALLRRGDTAGLVATFPRPAPSDRPRDHFVIVGHAWHLVASERIPEFYALLPALRASAERWGDPLALLRADLLDAYAREAIGDSEGALAIYDELAPRVDALFDPHSSEALWLQLRRATLSERTGRHADAIALADDAWIRLRYVDEAQPAILRDLAHVFVRHTKLERATLALARWREAVEGQPEQLREALEFEKALVLARRDAELARIDGALAKLEPETE